MSWCRNNAPSPAAPSAGIGSCAEGTSERGIRQPTDSYRLARAGRKAAARSRFDPHAKALRASAAACLLAALLLGIPRPAPAQESFEARFQRVMDEMYNKGEMEAACDAFTDLAREKPGDKQTQTYRTLSCTQVKAAQKMEENLFNEGVKFYEQGQYDDARQRFQQSGKIQGLKNFHYKDKAVQYLRMIESRQKEEAAFQEAVKLYNERQYSQAQSLFNQLALGGGAKARDAGDYLAKIKAELSKPPAPKIEQPQPKEVVKKEPSKPPVKKEIANVVSPPPPRPEPLPPPKPTPSDETLRAGLRAYYAGDLEEAERDLSEYLTHNGQKQGLAYFFRGAAHSTRYFLNGEKDSSEKEQAVKDFQSAKSQGQGFQPPVQKYISPKILALYSQAATP